MRFLSLFSGIEAASEAWVPIGWECAGVSEIDPFACAVLAHRHPTVKNLGDITKITEMQIAALGHIDLIVFGSPCQDLSVAGKQKGLSGERSGLFYPAVDIISWARLWCGTRFALWENVPGAFSSNQGGDFAAVVGTLAGLDDVGVPPKGWGTEGCAVGDEAMVEWATLDAQWFGVAQRRRRIFALADFGNWAGRPPILLEPEGVRGDSAPCREAGQGVAGSLASRTTGGGFPGTDEACSGYVQPVRRSLASAHRMVAFGEYASDGTASAMKARDYKDATDLVAVPAAVGAHVPVAYRVHGENSTAMTGNGRARVADEVNVARCLDTSGGYASNQGGNIISHPVAFDTTQITSPGNRSNPQPGAACHTLTAKHGRGMTDQFPHVAYTTKLHNTGSNNAGKIFEERTTCLDANSPPPALLTAMQVRRLTTVECERLQGFPDNHTQIPWRNKPADQCPDGPRYKALGNSMAVPVMRWIGQKINVALLFQE